MLTLYTADSPNGLKVKIALLEMGIEHQEVFLDLSKRDTRTAEYLAVNPNGKVPAVVDGDVVVWESAAILLYLANHYGKLLPTTPRLRAQAVSLVLFEAADVGPTLGGSGIVGQLMRPEPERNAALLAELHTELSRQVGVLERVLDDGREYLAEALSIADIQLYPGLSKGAKFGIVEPGPRLAAWLERMAARDAVERAVAALRGQVGTPRQSVDGASPTDAGPASGAAVLVTAWNKPDTDALRAQYIDEAGRLFRKHGMTGATAYAPQASLFGDFKPDAMAIIAFDSVEGARRAFATPDFEALRGLRERAFDRLQYTLLSAR